MVLPAVSVADVHTETGFVGNGYSTANVSVGITLANDQDTVLDVAAAAMVGSAALQAIVRLTLAWPAPSSQAPLQQTLVMPVPTAGNQGVKYTSFVVPDAMLWDAEHPNLYTLTVVVVINGSSSASEMLTV